MENLIKNIKIKDSKEFKEKWHTINAWLTTNFPI